MADNVAGDGSSGGAAADQGAAFAGKNSNYKIFLKLTDAIFTLFVVSRLISYDMCFFPWIMLFQTMIQ